MSVQSQLLPQIAEMAREEGFARLAVAPAGPVEAYAHYLRWLQRGCHGGMDYLARNLRLRHRPDALVEGAKSVICLAVSYADGESLSKGTRRQATSGAAPVAPEPANKLPAPLVARYARGRDYHKVLRTRCHRLMDRIRQIEPAFSGRAFVDSAPIMERALAAASGLGWIGANGSLIVPGLGSYVVLAEIVSNIELPPGEPLSSDCDKCGRCAAACPTGAIMPDGLVDSRRCISYLTIEHDGMIDPEHWRRIGTRVFGCDACQEACPFNEGVPPGDPELTGRRVLGGATLENLLSWRQEDWDAATRGSATRRASLDMFIRNAIIAAGNSGDGRLIKPLMAMRVGGAQDLSLIDWALERLGEEEDG